MVGHWLVGWLVSWLVSWLVDWSVGQSVGSLSGRPPRGGGQLVWSPCWPHFALAVSQRCLVGWWVGWWVGGWVVVGQLVVCELDSWQRPPPHMTNLSSPYPPLCPA